jgi:hypothetical protein
VTPVYQSRHGPGGNCYEACVASLTGIPLDAVPDLGHDGWAARLRGFLAGYGWSVRFAKGDGRPLSEQADPPGGYAVVGQRVLNGHVHAAVTRGGVLVHDPSPRPFARPSWPVVLWSILEEVRG